MSELNTFTLPDVGEGLTEAEIVSWKVKLGDVVNINDILVEIETAKSLVELPSPYAGVVAQLLVDEGRTVPVGEPIISIGSEVAAQTAPAPAAPTAGPADPDAVRSGRGAAGLTAAGAGSDAEAPKPLIGSGPRADAVKRRPRLRPSGQRESGPGALRQGRRTPEEPPRFAPPGAAAGPAQAVPASAQTAPEGASATGAPSSATAGPAPQRRISALITKVLAKPPVRKAARDLGINLADVSASGPHGEVTKKDLLSYAEQRELEEDNADSFWVPAARSRDRISTVQVKGVRKATAQAMVASAFSAPHVSIFVDVDASRTMEFVKRLKGSRDFEGIKVSPLLIVAKAVIWAAARNPSVNASWGDEEIRIKHFMNLGIAAATPRGLMVPNIKDAQELSLKQLAVAINTLAATARAGKTQPAQMQGGTLTITNIGALGIDTGTPIINPGEVAIVAFGTVKQKPWVLDGEVIPRWVTTLGGSFDHRVVDGDLSARFMADVAAILEEPALLLD